jgi:hypothetical protein
MPSGGQDQFGKRFWYIGPFVADAADLEQGVHLKIAGATWYFNEAMDYETRITIAIQRRSRWSPDTGSWKDARSTIDAHRHASVTVLRQWLDRIKSFPVGQSDAERRRRLQSMPVCTARHIPPPGSVEREAFGGLRPPVQPGADGIDTHSYPE